MLPKVKPPRPVEPPWRRDIVLLTLLFGVLFAWRLGSAPLMNPDEGRYAEVPREMVTSGDWVTPRLDGVPYFEKPPLMYWAVASCEKLLGLNEWSARITPAFMAMCGLLLTYAGGRKLYGRDAGFWAAIVQGTSILYLALAHLLNIDMGVSVLMSATLLCFILAICEERGTPRLLLFLGMYASAALATLSKGLIGFLLPGAVMFLWLLLLREWRWLRPFYLVGGLVLFLAIAVPWHVLIANANPGWEHFYFIHEHFERFTDKGHGRYQPAWYFIPILILGLFPWTGFIWSSFREGLRGGWSYRDVNARSWYLALWAGFIFVFFSASKSKLPNYILPVFPPIALMIGNWISETLKSPDPFARMRPGLRIFAFLCGLIAAALCVAVLKPGVIREPAQAAELKPYAYVLAVILCVGGWRALVPRGGPGSARGAITAMTATLVFMVGIVLVAMPLIDVRSTKDVAVIARQLVRPADQVYCYHGFFHDFTYYTGRSVGLVNYTDELEPQFLDPAERKARFIDDAEFRREWSGPGRIFAVARIRDTGELFADPAFHYYVVAKGQHHYLFSNQP